MLDNWFIGTSRRINGVLIMRHYGYFREVVSGKIIHASTLAQLKSSLNGTKA